MEVEDVLVVVVPCWPEAVRSPDRRPLDQMMLLLGAVVHFEPLDWAPMRVFEMLSDRVELSPVQCSGATGYL